MDPYIDLPAYSEHSLLPSWPSEQYQEVENQTTSVIIVSYTSSQLPSMFQRCFILRQDIKTLSVRTLHDYEENVSGDGLVCPV